MRTVTIAALAALLAVSAARHAVALVPPMVASCFLPGAAACVPLNSYECEERHGRWTPDPCSPPPAGH